MSRGRRFAKPVLVLVAALVVGVVIGGCAYLKPGSLAGSQPGGIGSVRVHFVLCTVGGETCGPNAKSETLQYMIGIAVPPGSTPPASFTAVPLKGGAPIVFTRSDEVAAEIAAGSATLQTLFGEAVTPKEKEEAEQIKAVAGGPWPPSGLQGVGYISGAVAEVEGADLEWSVDADFGLPPGSGGAPFSGPFPAAIAFAVREVSGAMPASRPVHCVRFVKGAESAKGDAFCGGSAQQVQVGTSDLTIAAPKKPAQAFVGGSGKVDFPLNFASTAASSPSFTLSATTTAKGGKAKLAARTFKPGNVNASTHLAPVGTGAVTVTVPRSIKPGTYRVTLTAQATGGGTATGVAKLKVVKPKLKLGAVKVNARTGTATIKVRVPGAGKLTIGGKGVVKVTKNAKKAKTLTMRVAPSGSTSALLSGAGSARVRVKATFKPTSGISVAKTKTIVLSKE